MLFRRVLVSLLLLLLLLLLLRGWHAIAAPAAAVVAHGRVAVVERLVDKVQLVQERFAGAVCGTVSDGLRGAHGQLAALAQHAERLLEREIATLGLLARLLHHELQALDEQLTAILDQHVGLLVATLDTHQCAHVLDIRAQSGVFGLAAARLEQRVLAGRAIRAQHVAQFVDSAELVEEVRRCLAACCSLLLLSVGMNRGCWRLGLQLSAEKERDWIRGDGGGGRWWFVAAVAAVLVEQILHENVATRRRRDDRAGGERRYGREAERYGQLGGRRRQLGCARGHRRRRDCRERRRRGREVLLLVLMLMLMLTNWCCWRLLILLRLLLLLICVRAIGSGVDAGAGGGGCRAANVGRGDIGCRGCC